MNTEGWVGGGGGGGGGWVGGGGSELDQLNHITWSRDNKKLGSVT